MKGISPLSPRQQEVLHLLSQGKQLKEIARELDIAIPTVKSHKFIIKKIIGPELWRKSIYLNGYLA